MSLQDQIEEDISLFFDLSDMATVHTICLPGEISEHEITVVMDNDGAQRNSLKSPGGIYDGNLLFYTRTTDVAGIVPDGMIRFDNIPYQVVSAVDEDGMTQVTLRTGMGGF